MSYEGYTEYLCRRGHRHTVDANQNSFEPSIICSRSYCNAEIAFKHDVDETNGIEPDDPSTYAAAVREVGFDEIPKVDFKGNLYYCKEPLFEPDSDEWKEV